MSTKRQRTHGEHVHRETRKNYHQRQRRAVREAFDAANRAVAMGQWSEAHEIMATGLLPLLEQLDVTKAWRDYSGALEGFDRVTFQHYREQGEQLAQRAAGGESDAQSALRTALRSIEVVAAEHGIVDDELRNYATATGYAHQVGVLHKQYEYDHDPEVAIVSDHAGLTKSIYVGETGEGKSTSMDTEVEDRYNAGYKVIDLLDTDELESGVYDIPQKQQVLRDARIEMGMAPDFRESTTLDAPEVEILVPMTPALEGQQLPFDTEDERFTIRPFTIPAPDLTKRALLNFVKTVVSKQQEVAIGTAYEEVRDDRDDWRLCDLADAVDRQRGLADNFKHRVRKLIESLQEKGFIRDQHCDHALDWERIFKDNDTITVFSTMLMREREDKLMVITHLTSSLYHERKLFHDLPPCVGVFRELHELAGHQNVASDDEREKAVQGAFQTEFSYILRKNRHEDLEILADTQDFMDIDKSVRKRFNRAVAFQTQNDAVEELFAMVAGNKGLHKKYAGHVSRNFAKATGTVFGKTGPNGEDGTPFLTPVQFAPPSWHNFDNEQDDTGIEARIRYLDREELRVPPWDVELPGRFAVDDVEYGDESGNEKKDGIKRFANNCVIEDPDSEVRTERVRDAYEQFAEENGYPKASPQSFGQLFPIDCERDRTSPITYVGIQLNPRGQTLLNNAGGSEAVAD
jgi:hypothetical protein